MAMRALSLCLIVKFAVGYRLISNERWGADRWAHSLGNPCRAEPTPPDWADDPVLDVEGRYAEVLRHTKSIKRAIGDVVSLMRPQPECSLIELSTLPGLPVQAFNSTLPGFTHDMLDVMYFHNYMYAAHFRVMYTDWIQGRTCNLEPDDIFPLILNVADQFKLAMCWLMIPTDPHPFAAPYPTARLWRRHADTLDVEIYHFRDCSSRGMRDCAVISESTQFLDMVIGRARLFLLNN